MATLLSPPYVLHSVKKAQLGGARAESRTRRRISAICASSSSSRSLGIGTQLSTLGARSKGPTRLAAASSPARLEACMISFLDFFLGPSSARASPGPSNVLASSSRSRTRARASTAALLTALAALSSTLPLRAPQRTSRSLMVISRWLLSPVSVTASAPKSGEPSSCSGAPGTSVTPSRSLISPSSSRVWLECRKLRSSSHAYAERRTLNLCRRNMTARASFAT
mmetsp:Transcript_1973/g.5731  ORF Transcript_1973/g.5731 Transcript_1973/m.5731 type:complete len:224 (-) Transcript_1973:596-1267(-)